MQNKTSFCALHGSYFESHDSCSNVLDATKGLTCSSSLTWDLSLPLQGSRIIGVLLPFQHKLNYFSFCRTFEKLFIICAKNKIK
jgi:hypothetical protein